MSTDGRARAVATLLVVGLLWSTAGALIKYVPWPPAAIWGLRSLIAAVALIAIYRPSWRGLTRTEWLSALALAATTGLFVLANKWTTAANAILIQYSAPAWAALFATLLLGERATRLDWFTIGLALIGVSLFFLGQLSLDHVAGNLVALAAGVMFALNVVLLRKIALNYPEGLSTNPPPSGQAPMGPPSDTRDAPGAASPLRAMILGHVIAAVVAAPWVVTAPALDGDGWAAMVALGLLQQTAPTVLYALAIRRVTAVEGLLIPIVEPIVSPLWVWLLFGEEPGAWALVGGAIVVGAVTLRGVAPSLAARRASRPRAA